jgi:hypothetical protein
MCQEETGAIPVVLRCEDSRRRARDNRRKLHLLTDPTIRRKCLLRRANRNLSRWQRIMCEMGWAELFLEDEESVPRYKINRLGITAWVVLLGLVAFLFIVGPSF